MGKLIERLKNAYMGSNFSEDAHWSDDGKEFLEIVEEMRQERPKIIYQDRINVSPEYYLSQLIDMKRYLDKWLGELS